MLIDDKSNMERAIRGLETEKEYMQGRFTALDIENKALDEENKALMTKVAYLEGIEKEATDDRKSWNKERETLMRDKHSNQEKIKLLGGARDNILPDSCLKRFLDWLPLCMISMVAPKGQITGEELGVFMGALVTITAYIVSYSNEFIKVTALGAFAALLGIFIGKIFNNIVTFISMDNTDGFCTSMKKASSQAEKCSRVLIIIHTEDIRDGLCLIEYQGRLDNRKAS
ncbi:unnamed protein product [Arabis nemorensis]|uniref:Uncharacterized protein n=1 Tax=Arabis nemorensis TaxID=586526 RepID=A0A565AVS2_9BRAS|nr:unnamed protein product [Arabis nemorensis]